MLYPVQDQTLYRCIAIALAQKRFLRSSLRELLYDRGLYPDLHQELAAAGVEAWRAGYDPDKDFTKIKNLVGRRMYAFFKANGIHRQWDPVTKKQGKGYCMREMHLPEYREPSVLFAENEVLLMYLKDMVLRAFGRETWRKVWLWAHSRKIEPLGEVAQVIQYIRREFAADVNSGIETSV